MKANELREKTTEALSKELIDTLREQFIFRMQRSTGQLKKSSDMKNARRKIARIKTVLNEMKASGK
ncbi:MAG: 50S ribosomal protein L29 [Cocleimonas sp.]|nr:50S ribosomal protein L29 [Cocleimonas sp.]